MDENVYVNSIPMQDRSDYRTAVVRESEASEENATPEKHLEPKKNSKLKSLQITVICVFVLQIALIGAISYVFLMALQLQAQSASHEKESNRLAKEDMELNASTELQAQIIKNINATLMQLSEKSNRLEKEDMELNASTELQAQIINNMNATLVQLSERTAERTLFESRTPLNWNGVTYVSRNGKKYRVYSDMTTDGGGWTVFQRRLDGSVDFYKKWEEYAQGFGDLYGEFWLGLEKVYQLTQGGNYELRVDIRDWEGNSAYAKYGKFSISNSSDFYRLTVGQYVGTAGDSLTLHNNVQFKAKDKGLGGSCAVRLGGAWWYNNCAHSSLNGVYNDTSGPERGVFWDKWKSTRRYSMKTSEMKFRKKQN